VVLHPQHVGGGGAGDHAVRVLDVDVIGALGRHEVGAHAIGRQWPGRPSVARLPDAATRHCNRDMARIARVDDDRMDAGVVITTPKPGPSPGFVPKSLAQLPASATVFGTE